MQPDAPEAFAALFASLWAEREQAYMGVRRPSHGSDVPVHPVSSRFALGVAARAVTLMPEIVSCAAARALWAPVFDALREVWLRYSDHMGNDGRWLVNWAFTCAGVAHRDATTRDPQDPALRVELEDALGYVEMDRRLVIRVASSWLANGWAATEVVDFLRHARIDLHAVCVSLAAEPDEWRGGHAEDLTLVQNAIA